VGSQWSCLCSSYPGSWRAHRFSGRVLLAAGLLLVCVGLFWPALVVQEVAYRPLIGGMLLTGVNGESTKVAKRSGMASSGVSGTVRFSGLVIGIAALDAVLYGRVALTVANGLPYATMTDRLTLVRYITARNFSAAAFTGRDPASIKALGVAGFASGYHALFLAGAVFMLVSTILTWYLVRASETPPVPTPSLVRKARFGSA
jgi:hypothetical protein